MQNPLSKGGGFTSLKLSSLNLEDGNNHVWNSEKVNSIIQKVEVEGLDIRGMQNSPFKENDILLKKANLPFEYTREEIEELGRCKIDPMHFALHHAFIRTHKGDMVVKDAGGLRDFQSQIIQNMHNNKFNILMASRQIGKTVTTAIYIVWFLLFNKDKNVLMVADNMSTTKEIMEKLRIVLDNLPFYMKPGISKINESSIRLDNDCRLVLRTTTKKSGIGMTVNFLYIDEFAHIAESNLDKFYRAILPTITEDPFAKVMITSTPNGRNKFWEIWTSSIDGDNEYSPMRVDWWQVPGRDEEWKKKTIANFGTETDFNQEYGLQFFSSDQLLLSSNDLKKIDNLQSIFVNTKLDLNEDDYYINDYLTVHPKYRNYSLSDFKNDPSYFVLSIDTADGMEQDYSILNIFKVAALPIKELLKNKKNIRQELDAISIVQIGKFKCNTLNINDFAIACEKIIYEVFNPEKIRVILELNHKGEILLNRFETNDQYWWGQMVHTKHTDLSKNLKAGVRLGPTNKLKYCEKLRYYVSTNRVLITDYDTFLELSSFGKSKGGSYRCQSGNDDLAMTCVNTSPFFESPQFWEIGGEVYENTSSEYKHEMYDKILDVKTEKQAFDFDRLQDMTNQLNPKDSLSNKKRSVFDLNTLKGLNRTQKKFYNS
jgi:hypothetical protein